MEVATTVPPGGGSSGATALAGDAAGADGGEGAREGEVAVGALAQWEPGRIVQLEETVINRIAAGEVVVRPANALKELMENCLDAGSKHVVVALKAGGLKMLRIEDDGHGIRKEDMPILCERFTTSKLRKYEDLAAIGTFGFRGEALASISHVAHVTVTTMTERDSCAQVAQYTDGRLRAPPRPCAGTRGTTLVVEDLFYNNPTRRQALGKDSIEHAKCLDVVQKYAIHYPRVSFSCRKAAGAVAELHTAGGAEATSRQVIGVVQGSTLASQLFEFQASSVEPVFTCRGLATGPQWTARGLTLTLFINNRLVECAPLRRAVEAVYAPVLPRHQHPWVYLALDLDPATVDVNVHPTKSEVQFLHEEAIGHRIQEVLGAKLKERAGVRTFDAQTSLLACGAGPATGNSSALVPIGPAAGRRQPTAAPPPPLALGSGYAGGAAIVAAPAATAACAALGAFAAGMPDAAGAPAGLIPIELDPPEEPGSQQFSQRQPLPPPPPQQQQQGPKRVELNPLRVRTDHRQRSLDSVWREARAVSSQALEAAAVAGSGAEAPEGSAAGAAASRGACGPFEEDEASRREAFEEAQQLTSVVELKASASQAADRELSQSLNQSVYVGPVSRDLALVQCGATLCLVNLAILAKEFAYQRVLRLFGGAGRIALREPLPLQDLLRLGIQDPGSGYDPVAHAGVDVSALAARFAALLAEKAELLHEYFMMDIAEGRLWSVPNALGVASDTGLKFDDLPLFLIRVCAETNWEEEGPCFGGLCRLAADFAVEALLPSREEAARCLASTAGAAGPATEFAALNAAVEAGEYPDVATAAAALRRKRPRTSGGQGPLQELRFLHEALRRDAAAAGAAGACRWPGAFKKDGTVVSLVSLEQLYKIFERC